MTAEKNLPLPQSAVEKEKLYGRPRQLVGLTIMPMVAVT